MQAVLTALSAMGKSTCREIAARMEKDVREMMSILQDMEDRGEVDFVNGYWSLPGQQLTAPAAPAHKPTANTRPPVTALKGAPVKPIEPQDVVQQLRERGPLTAPALGDIFGRAGKAMAGVLGGLASKGIVIKNGIGKGVTWSAPEETPEVISDAVSDFKADPVDVGANDAENAVTAQTAQQNLIPGPPLAEENAMQEKTTAEIVENIPVFTSRSTDLIVPTASSIASEIRRTKAKLKNLEKLRVTVREIRRQKNLILAMGGEA